MAIGILQAFREPGRAGPARPRAYLDHNATSPIRPEVLAAVTEAMRVGGNPSSVHAEGRSARARVETARGAVAALVGGRPDGVLFSSGGTEANNTVLRPGALLARNGLRVRRLAVGAAEHPSVLHGHGFPACDTAIVGVDEAGRIDLDRLEAALRERPGEGALVSVQVANSETGIVQPVAEIAALVRRHGAVLHADAVQAAGRLPLDMGEFGADALTLSGHKLGGPAGTGALVIAAGRAGPALPFVRGGGQELRLRAGTENVGGIAGFGVAASLAASSREAEAARLLGLREAAEAEIGRLAPSARIFGRAAPRLPNTVSFAVPGLPAATALMALDLDGVAVSSGSACSSGSVGRSHVLAAMGVPEDLAAGAVRLSLGWSSTHDDVKAFAKAFERLLQRLYERSRAA